MDSSNVLSDPAADQPEPAVAAPPRARPRPFARPRRWRRHAAHPPISGSANEPDAAREAPAPSLVRRALQAAARDVAAVLRFRHVVQQFVTQELRVRYQRSALGFLWTLLNPILIMTTQALVFSMIFEIRTANYAVHLFAGMIPWSFLSLSVNEAAASLMQNEGLIRKIHVPKLIFPLVRVLVNLATCGLSLAALFLMLIPLGAPVSTALLALPAALALFAVFTLGLALAVAVLNTYYRDVGHMVGVLLQVWYYATPILYPVSLFPENIRARFDLNPAWPFVQLFQNILSAGVWPPADIWLRAAVVAAITLGIGYALYKRFEPRLVYRL